MFLYLNKSALVNRLRMKIGGELIFIASSLLVNAGNYFYNLFLGRAVGPEVFAETGLIITFLLILSFLGMTLQLFAAKYIVELKGTIKDAFQGNLTFYSIVLGVILAVVIWQISSQLEVFFSSLSAGVLSAFAVGLSAYFYLSVMRGTIQGQQRFKQLSLSYQVEMIIRFLVTALLIFGFEVSAALGVSVAISVSIIVSAVVCGKPQLKVRIARYQSFKPIIVFFLSTLGYEVVQMLINYYDVLLVNHYFEALTAGHYTSLSLIGRMVYFITWMVVMLLLPQVINARKQGKPYQHLLNTYLSAIGIFVFITVVGCYFFSDQIVFMMFGEKYLAISPLLWKYALATGLFALGNIFTYYYLSLENYAPIGITALSALLMMVTLVFRHQTLEVIVDTQILFMSVTLIAQVLHHRLKRRTLS